MNYKITGFNESFIERMGTDLAGTWFDGFFGPEARASEDMPEAFVYDKDNDSYLTAIPINSFLVESKGEYIFHLDSITRLVSLKDSENLCDAVIRGRDNEIAKVDGYFLKKLEAAFLAHGRYIVRIEGELKPSGKVEIRGGSK